MTTETRPGTRDWGTAALVKTTLATALLGLGVTVVGALVVGSAAAYGAAIGTALVVLVFGFGTFTVNAVAALMPTASLMFALLTYTLQLVAMALAFVVLSQSGLFDETVDATWLGCTVIACTLTWTMVQLVLSTSKRIPIYDLPDPTSVAPSVTQTEGVDR